MMRTVRFACPLDCFDACGLAATVQGGRVTAIRGDRDHPISRGHACLKGKKLLARLYHPQRLHRPLRRTGRGWQPLSWDDAIAEIAQQFTRAIARWGPAAILFYADSGYGGMLKSVDRMFFNHLGGVTVPRGSLCWAAGMAAQRYDLGDVRGHAPHDMARAHTVLLWSRNAVATSPHLIPYLQQARRSGGQIIAIDPLFTRTAAWADVHIQPRPGTDGALALGMAHHLVRQGWIDRGFIDRHTLGFDDLAIMLADWDPETASGVTGIPAAAIQDLAERYATQGPSCIIMGYGLQRYANGGQTVRAIDALAALAGQIGVSGGGANYANRSLRRRLHPDALDSERFATQRRTFALPQMARFIEHAQRPPIQALLFAKANPLVQMPDVARLRQALARVPFKVVVDLFMTDTARGADLVLPATHVLEEEDVVASSMFSPYLTYSARAVAPPEELLPEYTLFQKLAQAMGLEHYPSLTPEIFLRRAVDPLLASLGLGWQDLKAGPVRIPEDDIPWADGRFATPSGKFEFRSARAAQAGLPALPVYRPPHAPGRDYPLRLLSTHFRHGMHSQYFMDRCEKPTIRLHPTQAEALGLDDGRPVELQSPVGRLAAVLRCDPAIPPGVVQVYQGWWQHSGAVNMMTLDALSDMGDNAAYFETFCRIVPDPSEAS
jgi:anaerobic selenocysteine-containing dehydrogenase